MNLQTISLCFCAVIISGTVFGQQPQKPSSSPPVGVLRPKDPTGEPLPLKLNADEIELIMKQLYQIYQACSAYAQTNDQVFPDGKSSNEAFRELFIKGLVDDERLFFIHKDGFKRKRRPDGDIGTAQNQYKKALEAGECDFYYIRGQAKDRDDSNILSFVKVTGDDDRDHFLGVKTNGELVDLVIQNGVVQKSKDGKSEAVSLEGAAAPLKLENNK